MGRDAHTLHCPNCGSPADPNARRCAYCKARLATISCPACFTLMFDGAAFCPNCGAARARVQMDEAGARCPGCRSELQRVDIGSTALLECAACDGVWVDAETFEGLCADKETQAAVLHRYPGKTATAVERVRYRPCVRCGKMMNRVNFGRASGTVVDVCRGHGTYLDAGELHQIVSFIQGGGLDRMRERQIEELKEQERRLRELDTRVAYERGVESPGASLMPESDLASAVVWLIDSLCRTQR